MRKRKTVAQIPVDMLSLLPILMNSCSYEVLRKGADVSEEKREKAPDAASAAPCPHTAACAMCAAGMEGTPEMPDEELLYDLADLFKTFGDTTRIKILYALMGRELCVADLAELIGATQSAVSHQLRTLKQARLVKFQRDGKNVIYSLSDDHVFTMIAQGMTHICE